MAYNSFQFYRGEDIIIYMANADDVPVDNILGCNLERVHPPATTLKIPMEVSGDNPTYQLKVSSNVSTNLIPGLYKLNVMLESNSVIEISETVEIRILDSTI